MLNRLVPADFEVPETWEGIDFRLSMLTMNDVFKDYDAVMSSRDGLKNIFASNTEWPSSDLTIEDNMIEMGWHNKEFKRGTSFTYKVTSLDSTKYYGCLYIYPPTKSDYDATIYMWVRSSEAATGLEEKLFKTVKAWIKSDWPFDKVAYPGRDIGWNTWESG